VLRQLGYAASAIEDLRARGVTRIVS
jgi:hypothetical protein